jgi:hypothetical protein
MNLFPQFLETPISTPLLLFKACLEFYGLVYGTLLLLAVKMYPRTNSGAVLHLFGYWLPWYIR